MTHEFVKHTRVVVEQVVAWCCCILRLCHKQLVSAAQSFA